MNHEPISWSVEKQQHLANHLSDFWREDTWLFTSKQGNVYQMMFLSRHRHSRQKSSMLCIPSLRVGDGRPMGISHRCVVT